jgi:phage terminase large subunit GpA-like protein
LDLYLQSAFEHVNGLRLGISAAAIDTGGHHTDAVYNFIKGKEHRRIYGTKGSNQPGKPIAPAKPSFNNAGKVPLYFIGTDTAKEKIFARLKIDTAGAGFMHFNAFANEDYFEQLTSEKQIRKRVNGLLVPAWQLIPGRRNEMLDCEVLNIAALKISNPNLQAITLDIERRANEAKQPKEQTPQPAKVKPPMRKNNFVNSWR